MSQFLPNTTYKTTKCHMTGDVTWDINDTDLAVTDFGNSLMRAFISTNKQQNYSLSILDCLTEKTIEIDCETDKMPQIVAYIYNLENATPLSFITVNSLTESYIVGMNLTKGIISSGHYKDVNGRLVKL